MQPDRGFAAVGPARETVSGAHSIHLGNAWEVEPGDAGHAPEWVRRFGRPTGLGAADAVWLVIDALADAALTLNGLALPASAAGAAYRVNVTPLLRDRNLLVLVPRVAAEPVRLPAARGPLPAAIGSVRLEIVPGVAG
jgi:hypothetical protein